MVKLAKFLRDFVFSPAGLRFASDKRAVAAVEFGMVLPFLMIMAFGAIEVADGVTVKRKLTHVTSSIGDLVAQSKVITNTDMTNLLKVTSTIMQPYPEDSLKVIVSGVVLDGNSNGTVLWSDAKNTTPLTVGAVYEVPDALKNPNTFLVVSESSYVYTPVVAYLLTGDIPLQDRFFLKPRLVAKVCRPPQTATNCN
jgi:Flp pilus assembly protein TadG